jgi:hypothetical protein
MAAPGGVHEDQNSSFYHSLASLRMYHLFYANPHSNDRHTANRKSTFPRIWGYTNRIVV